MPVENLAIHALNALIGVDVPLRVDGADRAFPSAALAGRTAFFVSAQPVEHPQSGRNGKGSAERTQIAAIKTLDEQAGDQQSDGEQHERPVAQKMQNDRGFEWLDLGRPLG